MSKLPTSCTELIIESITPVAEYNGVVHTQQVQLNRNGQIFTALDSSKLVKADLIGRKCFIQLVAAYGVFKKNPRNIKHVNIVDDHNYILYGEIIETNISVNHESDPPSNEVEIMLDTGNEILQCFTVYWPEGGEHELPLEEIQQGTFVTVTSSRLDVKAVKLFK